MKKSETNACLIAGVLATSILLTGCGGGSGGGMSGLGATGAAGATGATGAGGTVGGIDLANLLSGRGVTIAGNLLDEQGVVARAFSPQDAADLAAAGIITQGVQVLERNGQIIGFEGPQGTVFGVPVPGSTTLPMIGNVSLPALPTNIPRVGILGL
ncbi:MAG: hypothetical protein E6K54_00840 [Gammaproteobacteria bacterium]|nr:MAG: hypothetical protein E6K54_00840 [Gammaproteobacteria bacterium]